MAVAFIVGPCVGALGLGIAAGASAWKAASQARAGRGGRAAAHAGVAVTLVSLALGCSLVGRVEGVALPLRDGDLILALPEAWFDGPAGVGDLVIVRVDESGGPCTSRGHGAILDRVVGGAGDHVEVRGGVLRVNGREVPPWRRPLGDVSRLPDVEGTVAGGKVAVVPTTAAWRVSGGEPEAALATIVARCLRVERADVVGRCVVVWGGGRWWAGCPLGRLGLEAESGGL